MAGYVWPRLQPADAEALLDEVVARSPEDLRAINDLSHPAAAHVEVGGVHVPEEMIGNVQMEIRSLSDSLGFPSKLARNRVSDFDRPATRILHEQMQIVPADAAAPGVWSFLTLVVLPDVGTWRFRGNSEERLIGHPRNVFRRLWWRGEMVGTDLIDVERGLGEDELVNIMERPSLSANSRTARGLAQIIFEQGGKAGPARSEIMRDAAKRVLRRQAFLCLDALPDELLTGLMQQCFAEAVDRLSGQGPETASPPPVISIELDGWPRPQDTQVDAQLLREGALGRSPELDESRAEL